MQQASFFFFFLDEPSRNQDADSKMASSSENPFQEEELNPFQRLFKIETQFMAAQGFFQNHEARLLRRNAANRMRELSQNGGIDYDPYVEFLAMTYFDRCISWYPLPMIKDHMICLLPAVLSLVGRRGRDRNRLYIDASMIEKMEHRILYVLNWQLQSVTPVCFLDFFISFFDISDAEEIAAFKLRSIEYKLLHMHFDATYTEFKPSIIAATALIAERAQKAPPENLCEPFLYCQFIDTDELENCLNILMEQERANNVRIYHLPPLPLPPHLADNEAAANQQEEEEEEEERRRRWRIGGGVGRATA
ncbi:unnamed protein product [Camellia sinensis]